MRIELRGGLHDGKIMDIPPTLVSFGRLMMPRTPPMRLSYFDANSTSVRPQSVETDIYEANGSTNQVGIPVYELKRDANAGS